MHVRLGQHRAESMTDVYARSLALFFEWCALIGRDWRTAPASSAVPVLVAALRPGGHSGSPGADRARRQAGQRGDRGVREFFKHAAAVAVVEPVELNALFDLVEDYDLPAAVRGERGIRLRSRPRHRLSEPDPGGGGGQRRGRAGTVAGLPQCS